MTENEYDGQTLIDMVNEIVGRDWKALNVCTSTVQTAPQNSLTAAQIMDTMSKMNDLLNQPDPIAPWMKEKGFDPDLGWLVMLPVTFREHFPLITPWFVRISEMVKEPMFVLVPILKPVEPIPMSYVFDWRNP